MRIRVNRPVGRGSSVVVGSALMSAVLAGQAIAADAAAPGSSTSATGVDPLFGYLVVIAAVVAVLVVTIAIMRRLQAPRSEGSKDTSWSLKDALSEEVDFIQPGGAKETRMVASSSRLIAMLGLIVLLVLFLGIGLVQIVQLSSTGKFADLSGIEHYFLAGLAMFVPYAFNQVGGALGSLGK